MTPKWTILDHGAKPSKSSKSFRMLAGTTRLELATSAVTGQRSNQLNYVPMRKIQELAKTRVLHASLTAHSSYGLPKNGPISGVTAYKTPRCFLITHSS